LQEGDWQLELLCNIAAAELLMPIGSFPDLKDKTVSIDALMDLRRQYDVSTEALLIRFVRLTESACTVFCAACDEHAEVRDRYRIQYAIGSASSPHLPKSGTLLPKATVLRECTAVGFTAKSDEEWPGFGQPIVHVEAVGIPPYPKHRYPRVAGIAYMAQAQSSTRPRITYLRGDATQPRGAGMRIICHVVNDRAPRWGGGFAQVVRRHLPGVQDDFLTWAQSHKQQFALGNSRFSQINESTAVFSMICQQGLGPSRRPRIRYGPLKKCLDQLAEVAIEHGASVHMPRIGCGQAGGEWAIVQELISETLSRCGIQVTVYDLPTADGSPQLTQGNLFAE
jgi:O-acetyl-ADP-ribose deacetylase (regulator of RNase III)